MKIVTAIYTIEINNHPAGFGPSDWFTALLKDLDDLYIHFRA